MDTGPEISVAPERRSARLRLILWIVAPAAAVILVGTTVRLPAYSIEPGPARDVGALVSVEGRRTFPSEGKFLLTTVAVSDRPITLFEGVRAWLDASVRVVPREAIISPGLDDRSQDAFNMHDIEVSKIEAEIVALRAIGLRVRRTPGARVLTVVKDGPAEHRLLPGDLIVAVGGDEVSDADAASAAVRRTRIGSRVEVTAVRDGKRIRRRLKVAESIFEEGKPSIGVTIFDAYRLPFEIEVDTGRIGGPSGGMVFALAIVDALDREDLTRGYSVAGTGTIALDGRVGPVGGVEEKVHAAERVGAEVFLVPRGEARDARAAAEDLRIVPIGTLQDAIAALRGLSPRPKGGD